MDELQKQMIFNEMALKLDGGKKEWDFEELEEIMERRANLPKEETRRILNELKGEK